MKTVVTLGTEFLTIQQDMSLARILYVNIAGIDVRNNQLIITTGFQGSYTITPTDFTSTPSYTTIHLLAAAIAAKWSAATTSLDLEEIGGQAVPVDGVTMIVNPAFLPIGGEYRLVPTVYNDGDAVIAQFDINGGLMVSGGGGGVPDAEFTSPDDFTAVYQGTGIIQLASIANFTITDSSQIQFVLVTTIAGITSTTVNYVKGANGVSFYWDSINDRISIDVNGAVITSLAAGDVYHVGINAQKKSYHAGSNSDMTTRIDNPSCDKIAESIVNTTNITATTHYYPVEGGFTPDPHNDYTHTGKFIDADGTLTYTVEVTNGTDATPSNRDWIPVYFYDSKNNAVVNTYTVTNGTLTFETTLSDLNYAYVRYVVVASGATNTVIIEQRKKV